MDHFYCAFCILFKACKPVSIHCKCASSLTESLWLVQAQSTDPLKSKHQLDLERAYFLVTQAFEEDEKENTDEAIELYTQAVELCIQAVSCLIKWSFKILFCSKVSKKGQ